MSYSNLTMVLIFKHTAMLLLILVGFHLFETDGPCDYVEHLESMMSQNADTQLKVPSSHAHSEHKIIISEHFGHSSAVIVGNSLIRFLPTILHVISFKHIPSSLNCFKSENFRPPID